MRLICTLNADLSALAGAIQIRHRHRGRRFYRVDYNVCVYFGGTQLCAKLQWYRAVSSFTFHNTYFLIFSQSVLHESEVKVMPYVS